MRTVVFCSEKGGVGKTTLSNEVFQSLMRTRTSGAIVSMDPQYGQNVRNTVDGKVTEEKSDPDAVIVDLPGYLSREMQGVVKGASAVVVPTRPTALNVEPFVRTLRLVRSLTNVPICVVVNCVNARHVASRTFSEWLSAWDGLGDATIVTIPASEAFPAAEVSESSVVELTAKRPHAYASEVAPSVLRLVNWCRRQVRIPEEG